MNIKKQLAVLFADALLLRWLMLARQGPIKFGQRKRTQQMARNLKHSTQLGSLLLSTALICSFAQNTARPDLEGVWSNVADQSHAPVGCGYIGGDA